MLQKSGQDFIAVILWQTSEQVSFHTLSGKTHPLRCALGSPPAGEPGCQAPPAGPGAKQRQSLSEQAFERRPASEHTASIALVLSDLLQYFWANHAGYSY